MKGKTLTILNQLQRNDISLKSACKLLNKTEKQIQGLFDSDDYVYLPTIEDEKRLFELEKENIKELMIKKNVIKK